MLAQIKTDDELVASWWNSLQSVSVMPDGTPANVGASVKKAYDHLLQTVPSDSIYCVATQSAHQIAPHHHWFKTPVAAATYAVYESLVANCKNVWYATSGYTAEPELNKYGNPSRSSKNVIGVKSFWVDLDVAKPVPTEWVEPIRMLSLREDKFEVISKLPVEQQELCRKYLSELDKYHSQQSAVEGLVSFIQKTGLKPTSVVSSGRGVHAYWCFDVPVTVNAWKQVAEGFKALTNHYGLKADPMRTADAASLMRLPGTWHRKGDPLEVTTLANNNLIYTFEALSTTIKEKVRVVAPHAIKNMQTKHAPTGVAAALIRPSEFPPANAEVVATKCQQVKFFRQSRGMVDEPVWYLLAGTLGHCVNGESFFQEWSSGHPQYTPAATQNKMDQWMERASGPSSCGAFEGKNPTGCAGCPHKGKIAFPVQLGEEAAELISVESVIPVMLPDSFGVESKPYLPPTQLGNFRRTTQGIQVVDDALPAPITICEFDVWITRNSHDRFTDSRVITLCYKDHHGDLFEYQLKASILSDPKMLLTFLYDKGLYIKPEHAKAMSSYLQAYINDLARNQKTITLHSSMGWSTEVDSDGREKSTTGFVLGKKLITKNGVFEAGLSKRIKEISRDFHANGDKATWAESTRIFQEKGLEPQAFALLCGFGSPLMKFTGLNGSVVSLMGATGAGKTSAALYGLSIYGNQSESFMKWKDTQNAIYFKIAGIKNLPLCIDEMTNVDPALMSQLCYDISSGRTKARLTSDASLKVDEKDPWHTIAMMTTNESLIEKVKYDKSDPTAANARMLEYRIEYDDRWEDFCSNTLLEITSSNYGCVGEEYLQYLVNNEEMLRETMPKMLKWVKDNSSKLGQHRFLNATVACALVGAQIAKNLGLIQFELEDVTKWALQLLKDHGGRSQEASVNPYEVIGTFLAESNGKIFAVGKKINGIHQEIAEAPRGAVVARLETEGDKLYIRRDSLERWMANRKIDQRSAFSMLMKQGVLMRGVEALNLTAGMRGSAPTVVACYVLDSKKLGVSLNLEGVKNE